MSKGGKKKSISKCRWGFNTWRVSRILWQGMMDHLWSKSDQIVDAAFSHNGTCKSFPAIFLGSSSELSKELIYFALSKGHWTRGKAWSCASSLLQLDARDSMTESTAAETCYTWLWESLFFIKVDLGCCLERSLERTCLTGSSCKLDTTYPERKDGKSELIWKKLSSSSKEPL